MVGWRGSARRVKRCRGDDAVGAEGRPRFGRVLRVSFLSFGANYQSSTFVFSTQHTTQWRMIHEMSLQLQLELAQARAKYRRNCPREW